MTTLIISAICGAILAIALLVYGLVNAKEIQEPTIPKHVVRKTTYVKKEIPQEPKPKKKYYKSKKKASAKKASDFNTDKTK